VQTITLWHQMTVNERKSLDEEVARFHASHALIRVNTLYKETEELRSGFQAAALAGAGPQLIYGPSDSLGAYVTMGIVQDMSPWFDPDVQSQFLESGLTFLPRSDKQSSQLQTGSQLAADNQLQLVQIGDRVGNHLALVYNRNLLPEPPTTTDELVRMAKAATLDRNRDGRTDQYGLVWNFVEPFFAIPFLTGHGAWVFDDSGLPTPNLNTPECIAGLKLSLIHI
jgi:arabinogalactan oligomer/maltooligosaccharide transport system permease protein